MKVIDVYRQYFAAEGMFNTVKRNGALVTLTCTSDSGQVSYEAGVTFFPFEEGEFTVSYDACFSEIIYQGAGRRSRKREESLMIQLPEIINKLAQQQDARVFWEKPLREAQYG